MIESLLLPLSYNLLDPAGQLYTNTGDRVSSPVSIGNSKAVPLGESMNRFLAVAVAIVALPVVGLVGFVVFNDHLPCKFSIRACNSNPTLQGKPYSSSINRAQQAYHLEHQKFTSSIEALGLGIQSRTKTYEYLIRTTPESAIVYAVPIAEVAKTGYVGGVFLGKTEQGEDTTFAILCEPKIREATLTMKPTLKNGSPACPNGSIQID